MQIESWLTKAPFISQALKLGIFLLLLFIFYFWMSLRETGYCLTLGTILALRNFSTCLAQGISCTNTEIKGKWTMGNVEMDYAVVSNQV